MAGSNELSRSQLSEPAITQRESIVYAVNGICDTVAVAKKRGNRVLAIPGEGLGRSAQIGWTRLTLQGSLSAAH